MLVCCVMSSESRKEDARPFTFKTDEGCKLHSLSFSKDEVLVLLKYTLAVECVSPGSHQKDLIGCKIALDVRVRMVWKHKVSLCFEWHSLFLKCL